MIDEAKIEKAISDLESDTNTIQTNFIEDQNEFYEYLQTELFSTLELEERLSLLFINTVIYSAFILSKNSSPVFDMNDFQNHDESNWKLREQYNSWEDTLDAFFDNYKQEDLLAFVEDCLVEHESEELNPAVREILFITSKSYIDTICEI